MKTVIKITLGIVLAVLLLAGGCTALVAGAVNEADTTTTTAPKAEAEVDKPAPAEDNPAGSTKTKPQPKPEPKPPTTTTAQDNALESASDYLDYGAFSRSGLIEQLEFEGYSTADATWAVNHLDVDWNAQAAASAKDYLDYGSFSRAGMIEQLQFEGFTRAQAAYGATQVGL